MNFKLDFNFKALPQSIKHTDPILVIGSCFAEHIGELLQEHKFNVEQNPNGIVFNPLSIVQHIQNYLENKPLTKDDLFNYNDQWHNWQYHSRYSNSKSDEALVLMNKQLNAAHEQLQKAKWLVITWGSAHAYVLNTTQQLVANCHKVSQKEFTKKLISTQEIIRAYQQLIAALTKINPQLNILFTVSPVRYTRDGVIGNNISKAQLLSAIPLLAEQFNNVYYFPSYEIVIDELRDYRFFKEDLVHPNELAIKYVWQRFKEFAFDAATIKLVNDIGDIANATKHRIQNSTVASTQQFKQHYYKKCTDILVNNPHVNLQEELNYFSSLN